MPDAVSDKTFLTSRIVTRLAASCVIRVYSSICCTGLWEFWFCPSRPEPRRRAFRTLFLTVMSSVPACVLRVDVSAKRGPHRFSNGAIFLAMGSNDSSYTSSITTRTLPAGFLPRNRKSNWGKHVGFFDVSEKRWAAMKIRFYATFAISTAFAKQWRFLNERWISSVLKTHVSEKQFLSVIVITQRRRFPTRFSCRIIIARIIVFGIRFVTPYLNCWSTNTRVKDKTSCWAA